MVMNSEPSGTDADIPDRESAIDVFILCKDDRDSEELGGQLAPEGYRVTLFSDSTDLLISLRAGKPNLLICDVTGPGQDGYEVCREIKADEDLWRVPVLLVTGVASLGDLLIVLDSNADNFLARPYDPQYLLSLIETMLVSPIEKPDPEKIRTQFKIRHEDRDYVIMADRRKLLEFLLSSFEIAIDRAGELAQVQNALDGLKSTFERRVAERTNELVTETARLQVLVNGKTHELESAAKVLESQKREEETLRSRIDDRERAIATNQDEISRLSHEHESTRARLAEAEDTTRTLGTEKDELEQALRGDADALNRDLGQTKNDLEEAKKELAVLSENKIALETQVAEFTRTHEEAQKTLGARLVEIGQLKSTLAGEKNRADAAEMEVKSILQEKARAEQDLRQMVEDITEKAKQQSQECLQLADDLAAEKDLTVAAEQQCSVLAQESAKKEAAFVAEKSTLVEHREGLQQKYDALTASFGAEQQKCSSLETEIVRITTAKEQADRGMQAIQEDLRRAIAAGDEERRLRTAAETSAAEVAKIKDEEMQALRNDLASVRAEIETAQSDLVQAKQERDDALGASRGLRDDLAAAVLAGAEADKLARSASSEIEQIREELETERRLHHATQEKHAEVIQAKEKAECEWGATGEKIAAKERELLANIRILADTLETEHDARLKAEDALNRLAEEKETTDKRLLTLTDERTADRSMVEQSVTRERELLAKIQGLSETLDAERDARAKTEDDLSRIAKEKEATAQKLLAFSDERESEKAAGEQFAARESELLVKIQILTDTLETEHDARLKAEDDLSETAREKEVAEKRLRAATEDKVADKGHLDERFAVLEADLRTALDRQRSLEEQLRAAEREQAEKEAAVQALAREIEQATAALEAEKEERRAAEEAYAEAKDALIALRKKPQIPSTAIEEIPIGDHAIVAKQPDLPAMILEGPHALVRKEIDRPVPVQPAPADPKIGGSGAETESLHATIQSVEDLFEEPREIGIDELPDAIHVIKSPVGGNCVPGVDLSEHIDDWPQEMPDIADDDETGDEDTEAAKSECSFDEVTEDKVHESGIPTFSRQQWFDLVKWAHNSGTLAHEECIRIVKLGRLIQKGRQLTRRQEAQLAELMTLAHAKGYRPRE